MESKVAISSMLPLSLVEYGRDVTIVKINGRDKVKSFLASLGFVEGTKVMVISEAEGNIIFKVKDSRIALGKEMATRIFVK